MRAPLFLLVVFSAFGGWAFLRAETWLLLLACPSALAALLLVGQAWRRRRAGTRAIVVDGSNVLHWQNNRPDLAPLRAVVDRLVQLGYAPAVIFDANAGHKIGERFMDAVTLARKLGLPPERVLVAPKGTPADPLILARARDLGARIVSNDRFRTWAKAYPEVGTPGHLITGRFRDGDLQLHLAPARRAWALF